MDSAHLNPLVGASLRFRFLGPSGLRVSEMSLGATPFCKEPDWGAAKDESHRIDNTYCEAGGNFICIMA